MAFKTWTEIIKDLNKAPLSEWDATVQDKLKKTASLTINIFNNQDYESKVLDTIDSQEGSLALEALIQEAITKERKRDLVFYEQYASCDEFKKALDTHIIQRLAIIG